jgi:hypothetical protein
MFKDITTFRRLLAETAPNPANKLDFVWQGNWAVWLLQEPTFRLKYHLHNQVVNNQRARNKVSSN